MQFKLTKHQTARGAKADAERGNKLYLIKNTSILHATYQIRLLTYRAASQGGKLVIEVPKNCKLCKDLQKLRSDTKNTINIERVI